ncbi:protein of unknown function [Xenorhabdus poinarii G6]|uniref:Uncharacterized protein n=1 Tax=Xenorhabdus poinarii G6 TaxID=1354304 RepID=A0A068QZ26_9GAMM|nr:hypothetical protein [Xenorhabdus poinarii]CDG20257.1 protein of unknown function [Xenorhabdus poinarii G6]
MILVVDWGVDRVVDIVVTLPNSIHNPLLFSAIVLHIKAGFGGYVHDHDSATHTPQ